MVGGLRGVPSVEGGIETHCEHLYPRIAEHDCDVTIVERSPYVDREKHWGKISLQRVWSPTKNGVEALVHTFFVVLIAAWKRPDILHLHGIGPGIFAPLARLFRLKVVVTHHGPDYNREKWGWFARALLKVGEVMAMHYANERIVISKTIDKLVSEKFDLESTLIPNGVIIQSGLRAGKTLCELGVVPRKYILQVSRFVPEKRQVDLIEAFKRAQLTGWQLVFAGRLGDDPYSEQVRAAADGRSDIVFAGFQTGEALNEIYQNAGMFVLPSAHEGLPIALLEAASFGLPLLASGIDANLEVGLSSKNYFRLGNIDELSDRLTEFSTASFDNAHRSEQIEWVRKNYDWDHIASETYKVYCKIATGH